MAILQQLHLALDVIDRVDHKIGQRRLRLPIAAAAAFPGTQQVGRDAAVELLQAQVEADPGRDGGEAALEAQDFWQADVGEGGDGVAVERAERDLVEVDEPEAAHARAGERGARVRPHPAAPDNDDKGGAQPRQPGLPEEDAVARQLLQHQLVVEVAGLGAPRQRLVVLVLFVRPRERADPGHRLLLLLSGERGIVVAGPGDGLLEARDPAAPLQALVA